MSDLIKSVKDEFIKVADYFKRELAGLRIGRANPAMVENIKVEAYGTPTPLIQLASVQSPEPRSLLIQPWDKNLLKEIEKAVNQSDLGVNPIIDGNLIRLNFPALTEETRKEVVKKLHQKMEEARVSLRNHREKMKDEIINKEKNKEIGEDDRYKLAEELDQLVKEFNQQIKDLGDRKEEEIMTV